MNIELEKQRLEQPLYHYTNIDNLLSICCGASPSIWASGVSYMNDSEEFEYALKLLHAGLKDRLQNLHDRYEGKEIPPEKVGYDALLENMEWMSGDVIRDYFVFSLSEEPDLLSQWRSYTVHKKGVVLGFSSEKLRYLTSHNGFALLACIYDESLQKEFIEGLLDIYIDYFLDSDARGDQPIYEYMQLMNTEIYRLLLRLKHPKFAEEKEWRLVSIKETSKLPEINYRVSRTMLTPYVELKLGAKPYFHSLTLGPTSHADLAYNSLKGLELKNDLAGRIVCKSSIPYREW
jgi:hypothetical protein